MHVLTLRVDLSDQVVTASGALSSTSSYQTPHSALPMRPYSLACCAVENVFTIPELGQFGIDAMRNGFVREVRPMRVSV
jgi:hypothetical protein